jgi:membrane-associated PAP2 superfamily phosphatase
MMYSTTLLIHSWLRWAVLITGLIALGRALTRSNRPWTPSDENAAKLFIITLDIQMLAGLLLYFVFSPLTRAAFGDFGGAMSVSGLRFWAVEHTFGMAVAVALAHIGITRVRKAPNDAKRHRTAAVFFGLALLAILISIPWPGMPNARPLFRVF